MTEDPTGDLLPQVKAKYPDRFRMDPNPPNTYWFFLNETVPPFDKLEARQAVNYAIDSRALQRIFGGRLEPTCNFLPPGYARRATRRSTRARTATRTGPPQHRQGQGSSSRSPAPRAEGHGLGQQQGPAPGDHRVPARRSWSRSATRRRRRSSTSRCTSRRSATRRPRPRPASRTGTRTSRIRRTSSSRTCRPRHWRPTRRSTSSSRATRSSTRRSRTGTGRPGDVADRVGGGRQVRHRQRERGGLRQRAVDVVLLGADGREELLRREPGLQERLAAVLPEVTRSGDVREGAQALSRAAR